MKIVTGNRDSVPTTSGSLASAGPQATADEASREPDPPNSAAPGDWRSELRSAIRDPAELCRRLGLPESLGESARRAHAAFPLLVTESFLARMRPGDSSDPLLRQVLPTMRECEPPPSGYATDPLNESDYELTSGLLKKYHGRALLVATGACAIHCRYCFRRHFPYHAGPPREDRWTAALDELARDESIQEVLISGGDPLTLDDDDLGPLASKLASIPHVKRLRIHTRLPIVLPNRVNDQLLAWLGDLPVQTVVVLHANHAQELDDTVAAAILRLRAGSPTGHGRPPLLLNQAVLLSGVNDTADAQRALCERLVDLGVTPYYLHQMDRVAGAAHFETRASVGITLIEQLRRELPGYAVPRLAQETPGQPHKVILA